MIQKGLIGFITGIVLLALIVFIFRRQVDREREEKMKNKDE